MESEITVPRKATLKYIHLASLALFVANTLWLFHTKSTDDNRHASLAHFIQLNTAPGSVILITGRDWAPDIPYLTKRKALMFPDFSNEQANATAARALIATKLAVSAYLDCGDAKGTQLMRNYFNVATEPMYAAGRCKLFRVQ
jgi:hypothetical protein